MFPFRALLAVVCLLSFASAGCDKLAKSAAKTAAREAARDQPDDGEDSDRVAELKATLKMEKLQKIQAKLESAQTLMPTNQQEALRDIDAAIALDDADRARVLPPSMRALVTFMRAEMLLALGRDADAKSAYEATVAALGTSAESDDRQLAAQALYRIGRFAEAHTIAKAAVDPSDFNDLANYAEVAILAGSDDAPAAFEKARGGDNVEIAAVLGAYEGVLEASRGRRTEALKALDQSLAAGAKLTESEWWFGTLGTPFAGDLAWQQCASAWYGTLRAIPYQHEFKPIHAATVTLRACVAKLPAK